jgi:hypothetical protein
MAVGHDDDETYLSTYRHHAEIYLKKNVLIKTVTFHYDLFIEIPSIIGK